MRPPLVLYIYTALYLFIVSLLPNVPHLYDLYLFIFFPLQLRNKNLIDSIQEEEKAIMDLTVKLKILPIRQQLNLDEGTAISY